MKLLTIAATLIALAPAWADTFNAALSPLPVIGESLVCSSSSAYPGSCSAANAITVDWAVGLVKPGAYEYIYGVETNTATDVASWEVDFAHGAIASDGFLTGTSFDSAAFAAFGLSLGPDDESAPRGPIDPQSVSPGSPGPTTDHVTWGWDANGHWLLSGDASSALFVTSPLPPVFGFGSGSDAGHGGSPWDTNARGSNPVPVPGVPGVPEPASIVLFGSVLFGIGVKARRLKQC